MEKQKPLSKLTNKEWRGTIISFTFFGIFVFFIGIYSKDFSLMKLGGIFILIGIIGGLILHYFFGIRIIQLRNDMKHYKYKNS